jgi:predicted nucleic acid-binding protein
MFHIYLDVCCLNRPFDDQTQERIHLEAEAVLLILARCQHREWQLLGSEAVEFEISRIPDEERRQKVRLLASLAESVVSVTEEVERRAGDLEGLGFKALDALHVACAEEGMADVLLTTDDRLLRQAEKHGNILKVKVKNPVAWLMEVTRDETS